MADDVLKIISAEMYKLSRRRTVLAILPGVVILSVILFFAVDFAAQRDWIGIPSGFYLASAASGWMVNIIALLTVITASFQISGEFSLGTVRPAWTSPISRKAWFGGKVVFISAVSTAALLVSLATIIVAASIKYGLSDLMEKDYLVHSSSSLALRFLQSSLLTMVSLWSVAAVTAMFGAFFVRPGSTIAVMIVLSFLMSVISIFGKVEPFLLSRALTLPFEQMKMMSKGLPVPLEWNDMMWKTISCASVYMVLALISGLCVVKRKEVTF